MLCFSHTVLGPEAPQPKVMGGCHIGDGRLQSNSFIAKVLLRVLLHQRVKPSEQEHSHRHSECLWHGGHYVNE